MNTGCIHWLKSKRLRSLHESVRKNTESSWCSWHGIVRRFETFSTSVVSVLVDLDRWRADRSRDTNQLFAQRADNLHLDYLRQHADIIPSPLTQVSAETTSPTFCTIHDLLAAYTSCRRLLDRLSTSGNILWAWCTKTTVFNERVNRVTVFLLGAKNLHHRLVS